MRNNALHTEDAPARIARGKDALSELRWIQHANRISKSAGRENAKQKTKIIV